MRRIAVLCLALALTACGGEGEVTPPAPVVVTPAPVVTSLVPANVSVRTRPFTLTVHGTGFDASTTGSVDGTARAAVFVSATEVHIEVTAADLASTGVRAVGVTRGSASSATSPMFVNDDAPDGITFHSAAATTGSGGFLMTVLGQRFTRTSVLLWNGTPRATSYEGANRLTAAIPAADVAAAGQATLAVSDTVALRGASATVAYPILTPGIATVFGVRSINVWASDIAYEPRSNLLYFAERDPNSTSHPRGFVYAVDPASLSFKDSVFIGTTLGQVTLSDDAQYLYTHDYWYGGPVSVYRVALATMKVEQSFRIPSGNITDLAVAPGLPRTLAASIINTSAIPAGIHIFDNGIKRQSGGDGGSYLAWMGQNNIASFDAGGSPHQLYMSAVTADGARTTSSTRSAEVGGFRTAISTSGGRAYLSSGAVIDTANFNVLGRMGFDQDQQGLYVDPALGRAFAVYRGNLNVYDINTFKLIATVPVATAGVGIDVIWRGRVIRWASDGLAFRDDNRIILFQTPLAAR